MPFEVTIYYFRDAFVLKAYRFKTNYGKRKGNFTA